MTFKNILFIDIETVSQHRYSTELDYKTLGNWSSKHETVDYEEKGGLYPEFGKIISVTIGMIYQPKNSDKLTTKIKTLTGDEKDILTSLKGILDKYDEEPILVTHGGKDFDIPFICKRMIINRIPLHNCLKLSNKKPWEIKHQDTMEMWKFGSFKDFVSLELLATVLNVNYNSTNIIHGEEICFRYYGDSKNKMEQIIKSSEEKIRTLIEIYLILSQ